MHGEKVLQATGHSLLTAAELQIAGKAALFSWYQAHSFPYISFQLLSLPSSARVHFLSTIPFSSVDNVAIFLISASERAYPT
jgi:hypothetical protein